MQYKLSLIFILISFSFFGQEIGSVKNGKHSIKLLKSKNLFSCVYSDESSTGSILEKSFTFPFYETIYKIVIDGFNSKKDHQVIIQTNDSMIVRFEFRKINGVKMLKIRQNNFLSKTFGASAFFSKKDITKLFEKTSDIKDVTES